MRIQSIVLRFVLFGLAASSALLLHAQFQQPTDEELKMTADPKAPGAAAVYLYREETTDDSMHFHSYYERIKVLTEKGKELATIHTPYEHRDFKVSDIKGRTIHPDGTVIPLTTKPTDLLEEKTNTRQVNDMVFTLPSVEVGSILEYRLQIRYNDDKVSAPTWEIQQPYFVHKAHYFFTPSSGHGTISNDRGQVLDRLMWITCGFPLQSVIQDQKGRFSVDLNDIPAIPNDDWMPPLNTIKWRAEFYYTFATSGANFWQSEGKRWAKDADRFTNPTGLLKSAVDQIVAPTDTEEQKARKLYAAVLKLENTRFTRKKSDAERKAEMLKPVKDAEDVWKQQSGSDDDIALLYIALARAAGLKAWPMQVVDRSRAFFDPNYLSTNQLNDYIAIVDLGGKEVYLDPGQKVCPFGTLNWKHQSASGFKLTEKGTVPATTPAATYRDAATHRVADLTIAPDGGVQGSVRFVMTGPAAIRWRQMALENDLDEVKKQFDRSIRDEVPVGVSATFDHFLALDDYDINLIAVAKVSGNMGTATGKRFFLPGLFFESRATHPFVAQDKRTSPIDLEYAKMEDDDVTYHLPAGYTMESGPKTASISWPNNALLRIGSTVKDDQVTVVRALARNFFLLDPKSYNDLHDFYLKVAAADQQPLVLIRSAGANGN